eukprot:836461-Prorocentrum_minimum.AAC.1
MQSVRFMGICPFPSRHSSDPWVYAPSPHAIGSDRGAGLGHHRAQPRARPQQGAALWQLHQPQAQGGEERRLETSEAQRVAHG